jgi:multiple antibiotic resistance protein
MLDFWLTALVSVLFLVDPPGTVPLFLTLTGKFSPDKRRRTALVACVTATLILCGFAAVGTTLFRYLSLSLPAFQIAGGLVLFVVALDMIRAGKTTDEDDPEERFESSMADEVAITPLAIPYLAGPAAMSTVAVLQSRAADTAEAAGVYVAVLVTGLVSYVTLRLGEPIQRRLGTVGIHVLGRVLGLVLAGIAVQFVLDGLAAAKLIPPVAAK